MRSIILPIAALLTGCATAPLPTATIAPRNVYAADAKLPAAIRRVAIVPLTGAGAESLQAAWEAEWQKAGRFEVVPLTPADLRTLIGRADANAAELLPADFLIRLQQATGCEAVLFGHVTQFHAYPPVRIGWNAKLVTVTEGRIIWAGDEVFDAGQPAVAAAARRYAATDRRQAPPLHDPGGILLSPRGFGHFTAAALVATVPGR